MGKVHAVSKVIKAATNSVPMNTKNIIVISFPKFSDWSMLAIAEAMAKNTNGTTAVKSRFRKILPIGLMTSMSLPKMMPRILPITSPPSNNKIPP